MSLPRAALAVASLPWANFQYPFREKSLKALLGVLGRGEIDFGASTTNCRCECRKCRSALIQLQRFFPMLIQLRELLLQCFKVGRDLFHALSIAQGGG